MKRTMILVILFALVGFACGEAGEEGPQRQRYCETGEEVETWVKVSDGVLEAGERTPNTYGTHYTDENFGWDRMNLRKDEFRFFKFEILNEYDVEATRCTSESGFVDESPVDGACINQADGMTGGLIGLVSDRPLEYELYISGCVVRQ